MERKKERNLFATNNNNIKQECYVTGVDANQYFDIMSQMTFLVPDHNLAVHELMLKTKLNKMLLKKRSANFPVKVFK